MRVIRLAITYTVIGYLSSACVARPDAAQSTPRFEAAAGQSVSARSERLARVRVLHDPGARPRFSPDGRQIVFDRRNDDGFYDVYLSDLDGRIIRSLSEGRDDVPQRNNGNARFHPSGKYIVFVSEEPEHFGLTIKALGDPGIGLFSNFRATTPDASASWRLTDIPIKRNLLDKTVAQAVVNPVFSPDGETFVWTERWAQGGHNNWGRWRLKSADFGVSGGRPMLEGEEVLYTPERGNYATAMAFVGPSRLLIAGNPEGQHEYAMDLYVLDTGSRRLQPVTETSNAWEEGSCLAPNGQIVYMSNIESPQELDFDDADWASQPIERDYYLTNREGRTHERLTFFNDQSAPEFIGSVIVAACDISPDGRYLAGTLGVDEDGGSRANMRLKSILIEFNPPLR